MELASHTGGFDNIIFKFVNSRKIRFGTYANYTFDTNNTSKNNFKLFKEMFSKKWKKVPKDWFDFYEVAITIGEQRNYFKTIPLKLFSDH